MTVDGVSVVFICHDGWGKFLLHQRSDQCRDEVGKWDFGGGEIQRGEVVRQALLREVLEEYGVVPIDFSPAEPFSLIRGDTHWIGLPFFCRIRKDKVKIQEPHKVSAFGWFGLKEFPEPLHPGVEILTDLFPERFESI